MSGLLQTTLNETLAELPAGGMTESSALIDPAWIEQALQATGKASIRRRKLPAEHAVWLVIGLALFRQMPLWQVVQQMAQHAKVEPVRISFHTARHAIGGALRSVHLARAGVVPEHLQWLMNEARHFVLPSRRQGRSFAREVKRSTRSKYPSKKMPVSA